MLRRLPATSPFAKLTELCEKFCAFSAEHACYVPYSGNTLSGYNAKVLELEDVLHRLETIRTKMDATVFFLICSEHNVYESLTACSSLLGQHCALLACATTRMHWPVNYTEGRRTVRELRRHRDHLNETLANLNTKLNATLSWRASGRDAAAVDKRSHLLNQLKLDESVFRTPPILLEDTCKWLIENEKFRRWIDAKSHHFLWCTGSPGAGKSHVCSAALKYLSAQTLAYKQYRLFYFVDYQAYHDHRDEIVLQFLLSQFIRQSEIEILNWMISNCPSLSPELSIRDVIDIFKAVIANFDVQVYIVIDGFDDLPDTRKILSILHRMKTSRMHIFGTACDNIMLPFSTTKMPIATIEADDLTLYVHSRLSHESFDLNQKDFAIMTDAVVRKANGGFLLARLIIDQLLCLPRSGRLDSAQGPKPSTLDEALSSSLDYVARSPSSICQSAKRLINWMLFSYRPFSTDEIIHAFSIHPGRNEAEFDTIVDLSVVLKATAGLVVVDQKSRTLTFVHRAASDFLASRMDDTYEVQKDIAETCLRCLSGSTLHRGPCHDSEDIQARFENLPFSRYASSFWGHHASAVSKTSALEEVIMKFLNNPDLRASAYEMLQYTQGLRDDDVARETLGACPYSQNRLHTAAMWSLTSTCAHLIGEGDAVDGRDSRNWTPLHYAASSGHNETLQYLLHSGADINAITVHGSTPLILASRNESKAVFETSLQILLSNDANIDIADTEGYTALERAALADNEGGLIILLKAKLNKQGIEFSESASKYVVELATLAGASNVVYIFLQRRFHSFQEGVPKPLWSPGIIDQPILNYWRIVNKAEASSGHDKAVRRVFTPWITGVRSNHKLSWKSYLLCLAIQEGKLSIAKLLLESGKVNVNFKRHTTALHVAANRKDPAYVRLLVEFGADVDVRDFNRETALHRAVINGFIETTEALLLAGSDPNITRRKVPGSDYRRRGNEISLIADQMSLMFACPVECSAGEIRDTQGQMVDLLLKHGANPLSLDKSGRTCLHYATLSQNTSFAQTLLDMGIEINKKDELGISSLHLAVRAGNIELLNFLINSGADVTATDNSGRNCVHHLATRPMNNFLEEDYQAIFDVLKAQLGRDALCAKFDAFRFNRDKLRSGESLRHHTALSVAIETENWILYGILRNAGAELPSEIASLLLWPVRDKKVEVLEFLISKGAKLQPRTVVSESVAIPLEHRIGRELETQCLQNLPQLDLAKFDKILQLLVGIGLDIDQDVYPAEGQVLIRRAAVRVDSRELVQILVSNGANPFKTYQGSDVFLIAIANNHLECLAGLIAAVQGRIPPSHWLNCLNSMEVSGDDLHVIAREARGLMDVLRKF